MAAKIAVIGSVNGQFSAVFAKLAALHTKNNFSFAIIAGDLFGDESAQKQYAEELSKLLDGQISVPLTTYFTIGRNALPASVLDRLKDDNSEVCPNLQFLGRRTTFKTTEGIRIVALGGAHQPHDKAKAAIADFAPAYTDVDAKMLRGANKADILITSDWPKGITLGSSASRLTSEGSSEQESIADLCSRLQPRYHFSIGDSFYEREPFFHTREDDAAGYKTTRFLSLAPFGNPDKQKWIYAFSLDTNAALPATITAGTTASPLGQSNGNKKRKADDRQTFSRFGDQNGHAGHRSNKKVRSMKLPSDCFFCLSSPNAATHLVTSIGDSSYLTTAKGPLPTDSTFTALNFPGHMIIIPLEHSPSAAAIADPESRKATIREMQRYRQAMQKMLATRNKDVPAEQRLGAVSWEISRAGGIHYHQQFMPVAQHRVIKEHVQAAFGLQAQDDSYPEFEKKTVEHGQEDEIETEDCLRVWIAACSEEVVTETQMTLYLDAGFRFDLQYPRKVMAKLLELDTRRDWHNCGQTEAEETADAEAFKDAFKEWDFA
ncbi:hypothetical protein ANO11243_035590 [Dothideomycetidae sp. 11243]|nr:hypothetical protein ANO11243_035590 [fungal sp. No.11243]